eukprot:6183998-Pleurochrysis_carterae.AAC.8
MQRKQSATLKHPQPRLNIKASDCTCKDQPFDSLVALEAFSQALVTIVAQLFRFCQGQSKHLDHFARSQCPSLRAVAFATVMR